jgi:hypothetical protein
VNVQKASGGCGAAQEPWQPPIAPQEVNLFGEQDECEEGCERDDVPQGMGAEPENSDANEKGDEGGQPQIVLGHDVLCVSKLKEACFT